jgi:hypothetical protein
LDPLLELLPLKLVLELSPLKLELLVGRWWLHLMILSLNEMGRQIKVRMGSLVLSKGLNVIVSFSAMRIHTGSWNLVSISLRIVSVLIKVCDY